MLTERSAHDCRAIKLQSKSTGGQMKAGLVPVCLILQLWDVGLCAIGTPGFFLSWWQEVCTFRLGRCSIKAGLRALCSLCSNNVNIYSEDRRAEQAVGSATSTFLYCCLGLCLSAAHLVSGMPHTVCRAWDRNSRCGTVWKAPHTAKVASLV